MTINNLANARYDFSQCVGYIHRIVSLYACVQDHEQLESIASEVACYAEKSRQILERFATLDVPSDKELETQKALSLKALQCVLNSRVNNFGKGKSVQKNAE